MAEAANLQVELRRQRSAAVVGLMVAFTLVSFASRNQRALFPTMPFGDEPSAQIAIPERSVVTFPGGAPTGGLIPAGPVGGGRGGPLVALPGYGPGGAPIIGGTPGTIVGGNPVFASTDPLPLGGGGPGGLGGTPGIGGPGVGGTTGPGGGLPGGGLPGGGIPGGGGGGGGGDPTPAVPEPATWAMMIAGMLIVGGALRRIGRRVAGWRNA